MDEFGMLWIAINDLMERVSALEATKPEPLTFPVLDTETPADRLGFEPFLYAERN